GVAGLALSLRGDVVQGDVLATHEYAVGLAVTVHIDAAVCILVDLGRNRRAVPRPQEPVVGGRAVAVLAVEDDPVLVEAFPGVVTLGVGVISGNQQTPASIGVVGDEATCLRASLARGVSPLAVGVIAISESARQIPRPVGMQIERTGDAARGQGGGGGLDD